MGKSLQQQLLEAWERYRAKTGATLADLRQGCGFECDDTSLGRKLRGKQVMSTVEAEAIADFLAARLSYGGPRATREARAS